MLRTITVSPRKTKKQRGQAQIKDAGTNGGGNGNENEQVVRSKGGCGLKTFK